MKLSREGLGGVVGELANVSPGKVVFFIGDDVLPASLVTYRRRDGDMVLVAHPLAAQRVHMLAKAKTVDDQSVWVPVTQIQEAS